MRAHLDRTHMDSTSAPSSKSSHWPPLLMAPASFLPSLLFILAFSCSTAAASPLVACSSGTSSELAPVRGRTLTRAAQQLAPVLSLYCLKHWLAVADHLKHSPSSVGFERRGISSAELKLQSATQEDRYASCAGTCGLQTAIPFHSKNRASKGGGEMVATGQRSVDKKAREALADVGGIEQSKFGSSSFHRRLLDHKDRQAATVGHDIFAPVTNPVTTPSTFPPAPGLVTVPSTNPVTILPTNPLIPAFTAPPANTYTIPGNFPPITIPGTTLPPPATNPVTIYPFPPPSSYPGGVIPGTVPTPSTGFAQVWCIAKTGVPDAALQMAIDYACGYGADCSAIQSAGICYNPNTLHDHASYAFNSYYQRNPSPSSCDFGGSAALISVNPSSATCVYSSSSSSMPAFTTNPSPGGSTTVFGYNNQIGTNSPISSGGSSSSATTRNSVSPSDLSLLFTLLLLFFAI